MNYYEFLNSILGKATTQQTNVIDLEQVDKEKPKESLFTANNPYVNLNGVSIFTSATKEELQNIDYDKLVAEPEDIKQGTKFSPLEFVLKVFLSIDKIKGKADENQDGKISAEEAKAYIAKLAGMDGNAEELSLEDFEAVLKENNINLEQLSQADDTQTSQFEQEDAYTPSAVQSSSASQAAFGRGASYSAPVEKTIDNMTLPELEAEKTSKEQNVQEKQKALNAVYDGTNANVKNAKEAKDKAKAEYEDAIKNDAGAKKFAKDIIKNNNAIEKNQQALDKNDLNITNKEAEIAELKESISTAEADLASLESKLSSLTLSGKEEDKEKDAKIKAQRDTVSKQISQKKKEISKQKSSLNKMNKELEKLNKEKQKLLAEKEKLQVEKAKLDELVEKYCSETTKAKLQAFNDASAKYEEVKTTEAEKAKSELKTAKDELKEVNDKIAEVKKQQESYADSELKPGLFKGALAGKEALVTELCRKYGVDPKLVAAIIGLESGWGTSNLARHNNFGGYRKAGDAGVNPNGFGYFSTPEKGLEAMIKNLANYTRFSDVKTVDYNNLDAIGSHYCDAAWAPAVRNLYNTRVKRYAA